MTRTIVLLHLELRSTRFLLYRETFEQPGQVRFDWLQDQYKTILQKSWTMHLTKIQRQKRTAVF